MYNKYTVLDNKDNDIYRIISHCYEPENILGNTPTNRLLLLGEANKNLRCVIFSYSWDHNPEYARLDLKELDGKNEETETYILKTLDQAMIEKAIIDTQGGIVHSIECIGQDQDISIVLYI